MVPSFSVKDVLLELNQRFSEKQILVSVAAGIKMADIQVHISLSTPLSLSLSVSSVFYPLRFVNFFKK